MIGGVGGRGWNCGGVKRGYVIYRQSGSLVRDGAVEGIIRFEILQRAGAMVLTFGLKHGGTGGWRVSR